MKRFLLSFIERIEQAPISLGSFVLAFLALIIARLTVESTLGLFAERTFFFFFFEFTHTFFFFLCSFLLVLPVVQWAGSVDLKKAANILLFGFLIILTPPIIDTLVFQGGHFWSFYEFDGIRGLVTRFFTLFGDTPDIGITYGVRVETVLVTCALALYTYLKSHRFKRALTVALLTYSMLFILGTFPSWITLVVLAFDKAFLSIGSADVAALFLSPEQVLGRDLSNFRSILNFKLSIIYALLVSSLLGFLLFQKFPSYLKALWGNARIPQLIYHAGLLFLGIALAVFFSDATITFEFFSLLGILLLLVAVWCAWLASVIVNDCYDVRIDALTNPNRPLIEATIPSELYRVYGLIFFFFSLVFSGIISFSAMLLLLAYQAIAWLYSAPPLRLKQYPGAATFLAAFAGILVLAAGSIAVSKTHSIEGIPLVLLSYLFFAYFLALPIKDFKDIAGDKEDGVYTIPVLLGAALGKQVFGSLIFLLFVISPYVLHIRSLFFPALIMGGLAFFALQKGTAEESSFFAFRKLPGIILAITFLYGLVITFTLI